MGSSSPLMMVDMLNKSFYSLAENKVVSVGRGGGEVPDDDNTLLVGSSHGWLALFNKRSRDFFLWNPLSGRRINLPPIDTLPIPAANLKGGYGCVDKVIVSSTPDAGGLDCRAVMTYDEDEDEDEDVVNREIKYVVVAEQSNEVFVVERNIMDRRRFESEIDRYAHKTVAFDVYKIDGDGSRMRLIDGDGSRMRLSYVEGSLDGLAMFVGGISHSFALPASEFSDLKPDSIYFTDAKEFLPPSFGYVGNDLGIFDYRDILSILL